MTQLKGSLQFAQLPAVAKLMAELQCTGLLRLIRQDWVGEIQVQRGRIVGARLGSEQGRAALDGIAIGLSRAHFSFDDEPVTIDGDAPLEEGSDVAYLEQLTAEAARVEELIPSWSATPRLIEAPLGDHDDGQVLLPPSSLGLIPALTRGYTVETIARQRGVARTLRDLIVLLGSGLVSLDAAPPDAVTVWTRVPPAAVKPVASEPLAAKLTPTWKRASWTRTALSPSVPRVPTRVPFRVISSPSPAPVTTPPSTPVELVSPHVLPAVGTVVPPRPKPWLVDVRSVVLGFFVTRDQ